MHEILGQDYVNAITRRYQAGAGAARGYRDGNRSRFGRQHDLEKFAITRFDDAVATDGLARVERPAQCRTIHTGLCVSIGPRTHNLIRFRVADGLPDDILLPQQCA